MNKRRHWATRSGGLLLAALFVVVMLRWFEHSQVYHPDRELEATGTELGRPVEAVDFKTSDGVQLNGWFFPAATNASHTGWVVLVCHGNAGNISHRLGLYAALLKTGAGVFAFDYRGYGRSGGRPDEEGTYRDAQATYEWLRQKGFRAGNIVAYGESLGGGVASELCLRKETGGLILQSTFTSIPDLGAEIYPWLPVRWISTIKYDTRSKLPRIHVPVLVMHSRTDELIGFHHAETNFAAANEPKLFCELAGGHSDGAWDAPAFVEAIGKFLRAAGGG